MEAPDTSKKILGFSVHFGTGKNGQVIASVPGLTDCVFSAAGSSPEEAEFLISMVLRCAQRRLAGDAIHELMSIQVNDSDQCPGCLNLFPVSRAQIKEESALAAKRHCVTSECKRKGVQVISQSEWQDRAMALLRALAAPVEGTSPRAAETSPPIAEKPAFDPARAMVELLDLKEMPEQLAPIVVRAMGDIEDILMAEREGAAKVAATKRARARLVMLLRLVQDQEEAAVEREREKRGADFRDFAALHAPYCRQADVIKAALRALGKDVE